MKAPLNQDFKKLREEMVEKAIFARGVRSELVLDAMRTVPREAFLPERLREFAYRGFPLCRSKKGRRSPSPISLRS